jgi:putative spermidine/putrescine transport system substrate-binding protein
MPRATPQPRTGPARLTVGTVALAALAAACSAPGHAASAPAKSSDSSWSQVQQAAKGQTVSLWMYGGDKQGNAYVDDVLAPAAAKQGVTLRRVPITSTSDAISRILSERQAGTRNGAVDLVWVNGDNFGTAKQAGGWLCGWTPKLPNLRLTDPADPLLSNDFGVPVDGCESPWHKAQFTLVYDSAKIADPPTTLAGVLAWAKAHPGRFTYPAPPDFTGSVFLREVLRSVADTDQLGQVPLVYTPAAAATFTPPLVRTLRDLAPSLWRAGRTYPRDQAALDALYAGGQVDLTMTYGPATLTQQVQGGTFPSTTKVLTLTDGSVGNASFLAIPSTSGHQAGAMVVANLALSPAQQLAKAVPETWGQFTVLDQQRLQPADRAAFAALPASPVVPAYDVLSRQAHAELGSAWVPVLDAAWRRGVLAGR